MSTYKKIKSEFNVSEMTVYRALKTNCNSDLCKRIRIRASELGYVPKKVSSSLFTKEMSELRNKGYSNKEIADVLACSYTTVLYHIGTEPMEFKSISREARKQINKIKRDCRKQRIDLAKKAAADTAKLQKMIAEKEEENKVIDLELIKQQKIEEEARQTRIRLQGKKNTNVIDINEARKKLNLAV